MSTSTLILLIIIYLFHFVGDFVFQTRKMANNKSKSIKFLTLHVLTYCIPFLLLLGGFADKMEFVWFIVWLFGTHWITDFFTSKVTSYMWKEKRVHDFFVVIGFDQFIHASTLLFLVHKFIA